MLFQFSIYHEYDWRSSFDLIQFITDENINVSEKTRLVCLDQIVVYIPLFFPKELLYSMNMC